MAWMIPNELSGFVSSTKSSLPTPSTEECFYWPQQKHWVPLRHLKSLKPAERDQLQPAKSLIQKAVSGQSKCRRCGGLVNKGSLRVGFPTSDPRGAYEVLCCWLHAACSPELFFLLLQNEASEQQLQQLREDLVVTLSVHEATSPSTAAAAAAGSGVKAAAGRKAAKGEKGEGPLLKVEGGAPLVKSEGSLLPAKQQEENDASLTGASTVAASSGGPSTASASSTPEREEEEGGPPHQGSRSPPVKGGPSEAETKKELGVRDRLLLEAVERLLPFERLCFSPETLSESEQLELHAAVAAAARRLFFPDEKGEDSAAAAAAAAEEMLESLTQRDIRGKHASPKGLRLPLLPFQEEGLYWLCEQEASPLKGGILADEMGMGKTIQMISLLLARRLPSLPPTASPALKPYVCKTLIVTPLAALLQWKSELDRFVEPGTLSLLIYHGAQRASLLETLHAYDVVLTTFQTIEQDFRKQTNKHKLECQYCGRLFLPDKLSIHQKYFCGPEAERTAKQRLTEKKQKAGTARAMQTLNIINAAERLQREVAAAAATAAAVAAGVDEGGGSSSNRKKGSKGRKRTQQQQQQPSLLTAAASFLPTPSNCLKELLQQANIDLSTMRPNPWLGPHFNRAARAAAETPENPPDKKRKLQNTDSSSSNSSSSSSSSGGGLTIADVAALRMPELRELLKALGGDYQGRLTKAEMLRRIEPLLQQSQETAAAAAGAAAADDDRSQESQEEMEDDGKKQEKQQQISPAKSSSSSNKSSRSSSKSVALKREKEDLADSSEESQPDTKSTPSKNSNNKGSSSSSSSSSSSKKKKAPFKYVKPVKPKKQQDKDKDEEDEAHVEIDESEEEETEDDKEEEEEEEEEGLSSSGSKKKSKQQTTKKSPKKAAAKATKKGSSSSSSSSSKGLKGKGKKQKGSKETGKSKQAEPVSKRDGRRAAAAAAAAAVTAAAAAAERGSAGEESDWESSSTGFEPSSSSSAESLSSSSFEASSTEEEALVSESDISSVISSDSGRSRRRPAAARPRPTSSSSSSSSSRGRQVSLTPIDELLFGKAVGDSESEAEGEEGGCVRERLEEDPQLAEALRQSPLHGVVWQRIILDEAHRIKSRTSSTAQAIFALRSVTLRVLNQQQQQQKRGEAEGETDKPREDDDGRADAAGDEGAVGSKETRGEGRGAEQDKEEGDSTKPTRGKGKAANKRQQKKQQQQQEEEKEEEKEEAPDEGGAEKQQEKGAKRGGRKGAAKNSNSSSNSSSSNSSSSNSSSSNSSSSNSSSSSSSKKNEERDFSLVVGGCRWCLTGTPLQNRVGELYSLVRFLRFYPYAYYFCSKKGCNCRSMHYRFVDGKYCVKCSHTRMTHYSFFCRRVVKPIKEFGYQGEGIVALETLKKEVLDVCLLRRTKVERAADVQLPPLTVVIRRDSLSPQERDFYEALFKQTATQFDSYVKSGTVLHNFAHIFDLLSRLRQAVDHPYLLIHGSLQAKEGNLPIPTKSRNPHQTGVCCICQEDMDAADVVEAKCGHAFHRLCIQEYLESAPVATAAADEEQQQQEGAAAAAAALGCPACFVPLTVDLSRRPERDVDLEETPGSSKAAGKKKRKASSKQKKAKGGGDTRSASEEEEEQEEELDEILKGSESCSEGEAEEADTLTNSSSSSSKTTRTKGGIMKKISAANFTSSTKIEALLQELEQAQAEEEGVKSIVFSQFCSMLDLIEFRLKRAGIHCALLTGSMTAVARSNVLYAFNKDPNLRVILISLKAGGEGLNLQAASRVFLMDPWWNPAAEMQAIQRAHRIGQRRAVKGVRFICSDTIEERILQLQEKKQLVFDGTVGASRQAMHKLTQEDLRFLFQS